MKPDDKALLEYLCAEYGCDVITDEIEGLRDSAIVTNESA